MAISIKERIVIIGIIFKLWLFIYKKKNRFKQQRTAENKLRCDAFFIKYVISVIKLKIKKHIIMSIIIRHIKVVVMA